MYVDGCREGERTHSWYTEAMTGIAAPVKRYAAIFVAKPDFDLKLKGTA